MCGPNLDDIKIHEIACIKTDREDARARRSHKFRTASPPKNAPFWSEPFLVNEVPLYPRPCPHRWLALADVPARDHFSQALLQPFRTGAFVHGRPRC